MSPACQKRVPFWFGKSLRKLVLHGALTLPRGQELLGVPTPAAPLSQFSRPWGFPTTMPRRSLNFTHITLFGIRVSVLSRFLWSIQDFKSMESLSLKQITWDADGDAPSGRRTSTGKLCHVEAHACTSNTLICLWSLQLCHPTFPWVELPHGQQMLGLEQTLQMDRGKILRSEYLCLSPGQPEFANVCYLSTI